MSEQAPSKLEVYVSARLRGEADGEAARLAGYSGRPPRRARDVAAKAELLAEQGRDMAGMFAGKVAKARAALRVALEWEQASRLVAACVRSGDAASDGVQPVEDEGTCG